MRFLFLLVIIPILFFSLSCKTATEENPSVSSSPSQPLKEPEEEDVGEKPQTIIVPTGSLGEISESRIKILEKTLESKLDDYFAIVPKELFEEAQEKAFEELDYEECTEEQCVMMIQELLQIENAFQLVLISEGDDTQISLTWSNLDQRRVEENYCEGCKTKELRLTIEKLVEKLIKTVKSNLGNRENQISHQYDGIYNIVVFRSDQWNNNFTQAMGQATVVIKKSIMKITNTDDASLKVGDKNYWKTLDASINDNGEISGVVTLDLLYGPFGKWINTDDPKVFYIEGNIKNMEFYSTMGTTNVSKVLFKLRKFQ